MPGPGWPGKKKSGASKSRKYKYVDTPALLYSPFSKVIAEKGKLLPMFPKMIAFFFYFNVDKL